MKSILAFVGALLITTSAFSQDLFDLAQTGTPEEIRAALKAGAAMGRREDNATP